MIGNCIEDFGATVQAMVAGSDNWGHASDLLIGQPTFIAFGSDVNQPTSSSTLTSAGVVDSLGAQLLTQPMDTVDSSEEKPVY